MITLNLIPKKLKNKIETKKASISVVGMFILSFIIVGLTYELLFATKKLLTNNLEALEEQDLAFEEYFDSNASVEVEDTIKKANILFINIDKIQNNRVLWSNILIELSKNTPEQVQLKEVIFNREKNVVEILGTAETRENLLNYTDRLNNFKYVKNVVLPSDYLINPENISFKITANFEGKNLIIDTNNDSN